MGKTITEKILGAHTEAGTAKAGELIEARVDIALGNDVTAPIAISQFKKSGAKKVFDNKRVVLVPDHYAPNKDIKSAEQCKILREFAEEQELENYFEVGKMGVEHSLLPEQGIVGPGDLTIGADSHTCTYGALGGFSSGVGSTDLAAAMISGRLWFKVPETILFRLSGKPGKWVGGKDIILHIIGKISVSGALYKAMEYTGDAIPYLSIDDRFAICNMAIEAGAKNGIMPVDDVTLEYVKGRTKREYTVYSSDSDASYEKVIDIDVSKIEPTVAFPPLPENAKTVRESSGLAIDQVVIGSCTNGRLSDLRIAAAILKGKKIAQKLRVIVIPSTPTIYKQAMDEGLLSIFVDAGAIVSTPTCGPCLGGYMGVLAAGERALATTNRNFVGRMGHLKSEVYLCNPAVAAASALTGKITHPDEVA